MLAQALSSPFDLTQPAGQVVAIILFLIPGLNCTWVIERLAGRTSLTGTERLLRGVSLSVLIYGLASPWLLRLGHRVVGERHVWPWEPILAGVAIVFFAPLVLGVAWAKIRQSDRLRSVVRRMTDIDPAPTSWDFAFSRGRSYFVRVKLRDGERVGGLFGPGSNASFYPEAQDLYLQEAWRLDGEGGFEAAVEGTKGLLIRRENTQIVEFLEIEGGADDQA